MYVITENPFSLSFASESSSFTLVSIKKMHPTKHARQLHATQNVKKRLKKSIHDMRSVILFNYLVLRKQICGVRLFEHIYTVFIKKME